jgi:hypothetical protein
MNNFTLKTKTISFLLAASILVSGCASTTLIQSTPEGAKVFLNGEMVGRTPYSHRDTKIVGSTTSVKLEKEGYEPFTTSFSKDEEVDAGAIIGGLFFFIPFLWTMKYKPVHSYELSPYIGTDQPVQMAPGQTTPVKSKTERLRDLKQLLDEKVITKEEFEKEKTKILNEDEK